MSATVERVSATVSVMVTVSLTGDGGGRHRVVPDVLSERHQRAPSALARRVQTRRIGESANLAITSSVCI